MTRYEKTEKYYFTDDEAGIRIEYHPKKNVNDPYIGVYIYPSNCLTITGLQKLGQMSNEVMTFHNNLLAKNTIEQK